MNEMIDNLTAAVKKQAALHSIFDRVEIKKHHFNPERRSRLDAVVLKAGGLAEGFSKLSETDLQTDLARLSHLTESAYAETTPFLFQKYGWRIADPVDNSEKYPDAAFCDTFRAQQALEKPGSDGTYLLVKGDLTGIQEYIYHGIQPQKAGGLGNLTKRLRARSILVSLLTDFVANVILRELGLSSWHLLFAGGGHFNLLLPGDNKNDLDKLAASISESLRHQFGERLELIVASEVFSRDKLNTDIGHCFETVNNRRDAQKHRQGLGRLERLFDKKIDAGKGKKEEREERERRIGRDFPNQHFLLETCAQEPFNRQNDREALVKIDLRFKHRLFATKTLPEAKNILADNAPSKPHSALILALNETDFLPKEDWKTDFDFPVSFGFRFLGKNAPRPKPVDNQGREIEDAEEIENEDLLDFEQIAQIPQIESRQKGEGFTRLGSLLLDVDDLGLVFSHGINGANLPRIITLSRELNYFFTAHFNQRAQEPKHRVYVIYSGGDDAFAVGKWDMLMRFAKVLQADFKQFIHYEDNHNDDVHFSAGIFMSDPHYPVGRFYKDTKNLQERAKDMPCKNSVDVFDYTLGWDSYADKYDLGNDFRDVLKKGQTGGGRKFNASFAYRIMQLVKSSYHERDMWENGQFARRGKLRKDKFAHNIARMHYLFARNGFSAEDSKKITDKLEKELMHSFLKNAMKPDSNGFEARDYLVALNFAILQVRSSKAKPE